MITIGGIFGRLGLILIGFLALRLIFKIVLKLPGMSGNTLPKWLRKSVQFINKYHRLAGITAVSAIIIHFVLQYTSFGFIPTGGLLAGSALLLQSGAGLILRAQKSPEKRKRFVFAHTAWGFILVAAILEHRLKIF